MEPVVTISLDEYQKLKKRETDEIDKLNKSLEIQKNIINELEKKDSNIILRITQDHYHYRRIFFMDSFESLRNKLKDIRNSEIYEFENHDELKAFFNKLIIDKYNSIVNEINVIEAEISEYKKTIWYTLYKTFTKDKQ